MRWTLLVTIATLTLTALTSQAQQPTADTGGLQKAVQNPVAGLISVPIQSNTNFGIGPFSRNQNVLNIQPVVPVNVSQNWNLIIRWITPIVWQPAPGTANLEVYGIVEDTPAYLAAMDVQAHAGVLGLGDMTPTFFFSLSKPHKVIWATGPMFALPTATGKVLGQGKLGMGPSIVALAQPGHWTVGALVNNIWSVAGPSDRADVNQMSLQYFLNYNLQKGWSLSMSPTITANWPASSGNVWTVPVGGGMSRVFRLGYQPVNASVAFFGNAVHPVGGSPWGMRLQISLLYPRGPGGAKKK